MAKYVVNDIDVLFQTKQRIFTYDKEKKMVVILGKRFADMSCPIFILPLVHEIKKRVKEKKISNRLVSELKKRKLLGKIV